MSFKNYFNRKFYSKIGRATHIQSKPQIFHKAEREREEVTLQFVEAELAKVESQQARIRRSQSKRVQNSSSFLATTREKYMKGFKRTSMESPSPDLYKPNTNYIKPNISPALTYREDSKKTNQRVIKLPFCIDQTAMECSYPKIKDRSAIALYEKEFQQKLSLRRSKTPKDLELPNFVSFERQSPRKFLPLSPLSESRFDIINYLPKVSTKARRSPNWDFSRLTERKNPRTDFSPGPYDYDDKAVKGSPPLHVFDMSKVKGRGDEEYCMTVGSVRNTLRAGA